MKRAKEARKMKSRERKTYICPLCGKSYHGHPAVSREDNLTPICGDCGTRQALASIGVEPPEQEEILKTIHQYIVSE